MNCIDVESEIVTEFRVPTESQLTQGVPEPLKWMHPQIW
jgi:hypothetical protein